MTEERMSGYLQVLAERGEEPIILTGQATRAFGKNATNHLKDDHPDVDGVICFNDLVALGVLSSCAESNVVVGHDLRVVGFDDIEDCQDSYPPLSSVSCHIPELAKSTADNILDWIKNGQRPERVLRSPVNLIERASSR